MTLQSPFRAIFRRALTPATVVTSVRMFQKFHPAIIALLCAAFITLPFIGDRPFFTRGEGREALVAQSIVTNGSWLVGEGYGGVVPSKPPTLHWLAATFSLPFERVTEFTMRLPSALGSILFVWLFASFVAKRKGNELALLSSLILITSLEWSRAAVSSRVDMLLACLLGAGFIATYCWKERELKEFPVLGILCFAAAALTKGPVAIAVPGLIFGLFLLWEKTSLPRIIVAGVTLFLPATAIAATWYLAAYLERGPEFFSRVYYENIARFAGSQEDQPHKHSAIYLLGMFLLGLMPWTLWLVPRVKSLFRRHALPQDSLHRYFALIIVAFVLFFMIPTSKRSVYLLPVYPFASYFFALGIVTFWERCRRWALGANAVLFTILLLTLIAIALFGSGLISLRQSEDIDEYRRIAAQSMQTIWFVLALGAIGFGLWDCLRKTASPAILGLVYLVFIAGLNGSLAGSFARAISADQFAQSLRKETLDQELYSFQNEFYALSFYLHKPLSRLEDSTPSQGIVILYDDNLETLKSRLTGYSIEFLARSQNSVEKIGKKLLAVRVQKDG